MQRGKSRQAGSRHMQARKKAASFSIPPSPPPPPPPRPPTLEACHAGRLSSVALTYDQRRNYPNRDLERSAQVNALPPTLREIPTHAMYRSARSAEARRQPERHSNDLSAFMHILGLATSAQLINSDRAPGIDTSVTRGRLADLPTQPLAKVL